MNCSELSERLLEDAGDDVGDDASNDGLQAHLERCAACREKVALARGLPDLVRRESRPLSPALRDRILAAAFEPVAPVVLAPVVLAPVVLAPAPASRSRFRFLAPALVAACVGIGAFLTHSAPPATPPTISPSPLVVAGGPSSTSSTPTARLLDLTRIAPVSSSAPLDLDARTAFADGLAHAVAPVGTDALANSDGVFCVTNPELGGEVVTVNGLEDPLLEPILLDVANNSNRPLITARALLRLEALSAITSTDCSYFAERLTVAEITSSDRLVVVNELARRVSRSSEVSKNASRALLDEAAGKPDSSKRADASADVPSPGRANAAAAR